LGEISFDNRISIQVGYGRRIVDANAASLHLEFLVTGTPDRSLNSANVFVPQSYSSLFLTPGLKLKLIPGFFLVPYVAAGAGYARFNQSGVLINGQPNRGDGASNELVYNYGGGVELKIFPYVSLRGEIRDFVSGKPSFNFPVIEGRLHNVIPAVGLVIRF
jgi:opacity protein-like surface antigen